MPIVYSCSGCSSAAQMANRVAIRLDRERHAEMSCIAGVGGDVPSLVRIAKSGRKIIAIDGCPLHCVLRCLDRHNVKPDLHFTLTKIGIRKRYHTDFNEVEAAEVFRRIVGELQVDSTAAS
ncbi:putative zinc-binding protein [Hyphomicrobium sp.]|nr:putative zinc-binding protein [Hyphomicrobium sp.]